MKTIENQNFPNERALYAANGLRLVNCTFDGAEDGESALKEASDLSLIGCYMNLRYPLWHDKNVMLSNVTMTENCRAAMWYTSGLTIKDSRLLGIKALRECRDITINNTKVVSPEFGWKSKNITISDSEIESEYLFLSAADISLKNVRFKGKYSFQYAEDVCIEDCVLDTKDAFWHTKRVTVKNSLVKGEYLGWYSDGLTLINCKIVGTQPLCYCTNLKLIDCETEKADFSFEYSDVVATVKGNILSVKNPRSGSISAGSITDLILTDDSKYECLCDVRTHKLKA